MQRSEEQATADSRLDEAVRECARAYGLIDDGEVITNWIVAGATDGDDDDHTAYFTLHPNGVQPGYIAIGLLTMAAARYTVTDDQ